MQKALQMLRTWTGRNSAELGYGLGLFAILFGFFAFVQFGTPALADNDGYYHMRMGQLITLYGLRPDFPWLPYSVLNNEAFYDHHLLYHAYLALFVGDGSPQALIWGAKIASVIMPALAGVALWSLLHTQNVPWAWFWSLGICALSQAFLYRMSIPRAQSASLVVLILALHWLLTKRYWGLLPLGFVYVWLYNAFPLLIALAGIYALAALVTERRIAWVAVVAPSIGIALGLLINPYFPENISFIIHHLAPKIGQPETSVGSEWYPYDTWTLLNNSGLALGIWILGIFALMWQNERIDRAQLTAFLLSIFFGFLLLKARRFIEYFPPFALIFCALAWAPLLKQWSKSSSQRFWGALIAVGLLAPALGSTLGAARLVMTDSVPASRYAEASNWLKQHTPAGSMVFQTDWDDFPRLFFYNTNNHYLIGLDPTYMQRFDPILYDEWVAITRGKTKAPGELIRSRFGSSYIISDLNHKDFLREATKDPYIKEVYRDSDAVIFVVDQ